MEIEATTIEGSIRQLRLVGEMDLYNANDLKVAIADAIANAVTGIVLDLHDLAYIDSSGISALLFTYTQCKANRVGLCFVNIRGSVRRVIELTSLSGFFPTAGDLGEAISRLKANAG